MKALRASLVMFLISVALVETMLRILDPWGAAYFDNVQQLWAATVPDSTGYAFTPGTHYFGKVPFTINGDGTRAVPAAVENGKRVYFVGDSVTFSQGVSDEDTWPSLVSGALSLNGVNLGRSSYNIENIAPLMEQVEGCAVFLTITNDPAPATIHHIPKNDFDLWINRYIGAAIAVRHRWGTPYPILKKHDVLFRNIADRPDTLVVAFDDGGYGNEVHRRYGATLIEPYTSPLSYMDGHADAEGNRQIAEAITPVIEHWLATRSCQ